MSIAGHRIALVSLGSSCQPAQQLRQHAKFISEMVGDELKHVRLPFDWVISPIEKTTKWLRSGKIFPTSPDSIALVPDQRDLIFWEEQGIYFLHDFKRLDGYIDLCGAFENTRTKYELSFDRWQQLRRVERIIVVIANTQNNIPIVVGKSYARVDFEFTASRLQELKRAVDESFGRRVEM